MNGGEQADILEIVRSPDRVLAKISACVADVTQEGRDIEAIVETLGLPAELPRSGAPLPVGKGKLSRY